MPSAPVIISEKYGVPVRPVDKDAPVLTVAENRLGTPIVIAENGAPFIVEGLIPPWLPSDLFALSQPGIWLDGSDNSVMWQDAEGTTPVTALGQSVGLVLDKRLWQGKTYDQVMADQPELVQPGWSQVGGSGILQSGQTFSLVSAPVSNYVEGDALIVGRTYRYEFTISGQSGLEIIRFQNASASIVIPSVGAAGNGTYVGTFIATSTQLRIGVYNETVDAAQVTLSCKEIPGNHASQSSAASRLVWQEDDLGARGLLFDGVNDNLVTPSIDFSASDKVMMAAGVRKLSDAAIGAVVELSANPAPPNPGSFSLSASAAGADYRYYVATGSEAYAASIPAAAPDSSVLTALSDFASPQSIVRRNGQVVGSNTLPTGGGNFGNYPLYIGRRAAVSRPYNGFLHQLVVRGGAWPDATELAQLEAYLASKSGVSL